MVSVTATLPLRPLPPALLLWLLLSLSDLLRVCECRLLFDLLASEVTSTCSKLAQITPTCSRSHPPAPPSLPPRPRPVCYTTQYACGSWHWQTVPVRTVTPHSLHHSIIRATYTEWPEIGVYSTPVLPLSRALRLPPFLSWPCLRGCERPRRKKRYVLVHHGLL